MAAVETQTSSAELRTYGNWRRPRRAGIGPLNFVASVVLIFGLVITVLTMLVSVMLALVLGVVLLLVVAPLGITDRYGQTMLVRVVVRLGWRKAARTGSALYRSGPLGIAGNGTCRLPGVAAAVTVVEAQDAYERPFAMLSYPQTNYHVAVLTCAADGAALVDQHQVDVWVAHWGQWLAGLSVEPGLIGASVTVETAPDPGTRLRHEVEQHMVDDAPELAKAMLAETVESYPLGSAHISTRIALTYSGAARRGHPRKDTEEMALLLGQQLPHLTSTLSMTGAGAARPMTATELAEAVRVAYDPAVAPLVEEAQELGGSGLTWEDAGPTSAEEAEKHYWHDCAWSKTWHMSEAPRGEVLSSVLTRLLEPHRDIDRKRVTLHYRPHDPAAASRIVEQDVLDASFSAGQEKVAKARSTGAIRAAEQSAREEAQGAGVTRFSLSATATVTDQERLPAAQAAIENLAPQARLQLRLVAGSQAAAFAATLPIGMVIPEHLALPVAIRDQL